MQLRYKKLIFPERWYLFFVSFHIVLGNIFLLYKTTQSKGGFFSMKAPKTSFT